MNRDMTDVNGNNGILMEAPDSHYWAVFFALNKDQAMSLSSNAKGKEILKTHPEFIIK